MFLIFNFRKYLDKATLEPMESPSGPLCDIITTKDLLVKTFFMVKKNPLSRVKFYLLNPVIIPGWCSTSNPTHA